VTEVGETAVVATAVGVREGAERAEEGTEVEVRVVARVEVMVVGKEAGKVEVERAEVVKEAVATVEAVMVEAVMEVGVTAAAAVAEKVAGSVG
jgi:hypothetical protein